MLQNHDNTKTKEKEPKNTDLKDTSKTGKPRQWRKHKLQSVAIAEAYSFFEELASYGSKIFQCGSYLKFLSCPSEHEKRLIEANFCKCRLCVMCQWRKSLVTFHQVLALMHAHKEQHQSDVPLFLTLTVPNVSADELKNRLDLMVNAWKLLVDRSKFKTIRSWFRTLEITYNSKEDTYHPHFHVLLMVPEAYFRTDRNLYISQEEWLEMWRDVTGLPEITQVDIRKVRKKKNYKKEEIVSAEVAKYATKPSSYISGDIKNGFSVEDTTVISELHKALKNRRLIGFGGEFKKLRKQLKQKDVETSDLVTVSDEHKGCECEVCKSTMVEQLFGWHVGVRDYVLKV